MHRFSSATSLFVALALAACSTPTTAESSGVSLANVVANDGGDVLFACTHDGVRNDADYRLRFDESTALLTYEHGTTRASGPLFARPLDTVGPDTMLFYTPTAFFVLKLRSSLTAVMLGPDSVRRDEQSDCGEGHGKTSFDEELFGRMKERAVAAFDQRTAFGSSCRSSSSGVTVSNGTVLSILPGLDGRSVQLFGAVVDHGAYDITTFTVTSTSTSTATGTGTGKTVLDGSGWAKLRPDNPAQGPQLDARVTQLVVERDEAGAFLSHPGQPREPFASIRCDRFDTARIEALLGDR